MNTAPPQVSVNDLFETQAERTPDATALSFEGQTLTYAELNRQANQLARYIAGMGVGPEVRIALWAERSVEMVVALLGILKAGGAYVPLDANYPSERLSLMLDDAQTPLVLIQGNLPRSISSALPFWIQVVSLDEERERIAAEAATNLNVSISHDTLAYIMYTSGSTGLPKGVCVSHSNIVRLVHDNNFADFSPDRKFLQFAPISFDASTFEIWGSLLNGAQLTLFPPELPSAAELGNFIERHQADTVWLTAPLFHQMMESNPESLQGVRQLLAGGDVVSAFSARKALQSAPGQVLINGYGPTENTTFTACHRMETVADVGDVAIPIGRPITNTRVYVLDHEMELALPGVAGELYAGGAGVARGYLNRPDLTAEKFVPNAVSGRPGERLYRTGDRVRWSPNGVLEFLGRFDHQVKLRGHRVEPGEIETALEEIREVEQAVVCLREDRPGDKQLIAYCVAREPISGGDLRKALERRLPDYMLPAAFVLLDSMPLTSNGKIDRRALPRPSAERDASDETYVTARSPVEELLVNIWREVLGVEQVRVMDDFFALGGHSLFAIQAVMRMSNVLSLDVPLRLLFEEPTIAGLARKIEQLMQGTAHAGLPPIERIPRNEFMPLSYAQQRLWFLDHLESGAVSSYNVPLAVRIRGSLDITALQRALKEIVQRHETLRTHFAVVAGEPYQMIDDTFNPEAPVIDLSSVAADQREEQAALLAAEEARKRFDLGRGPLFSVKLLRLAEEDHVLLLTMHHIVCDAWSMGILVRETSLLYEAFSTDSPSPLLPLPVQYADYSIWQRGWLVGPVLEHQLDYWRNQLAGLETVELPTDRPRPETLSHRGAAIPFALPGGLTQKLNDLSHQNSVTLYMTLLAAFQVLLCRYSGQSDITVGSPIVGRRLADVEGLIGFFVNTLVLRTDLSGNPSFTEVLERVKEVTLAAYAHQDLPFEKLVEALQPERDPSRSPLFQIAFVFQNVPMPELQLGTTKLELFSSGEGCTAKFDMTLEICQQGSDLSGSIEYNTDIFEASSIRRLIGQYQVLLESVVSELSKPISHLPMLSAAEREQLLGEWNRTTSEVPQRCIHELVEEQAGKTPERIAVVCEDERLTYAELNRRASHLAHSLIELGAGPEVPVAICLERSAEMLVAILGILKSGGAYVPLEPGNPEGRLRNILEESGSPIVVTQKRLLPVIRRLETESIEVVVIDEMGMLSSLSLDQHDSKMEVRPENTAYILYTSGSTGRPKGVTVEHRSVVNYLTWCERNYPLQEGSGSALHTSVVFDLTVTSLFTPLVSGKAVMIVKSDNGGVEALRKTLEQQEEPFSLLKLTPAHMTMLLSERSSKRLPTGALVVGGEALGGATVRDWQQAQGWTRVFNEYGPTEATVGCCVYEVEPEWEGEWVPIGRPLGNFRIYVLDDRMEPVGIGMKGELYVGGVGLARGYLNRPDMTAERFVPDQFSGISGERLYRTGDLVRWTSAGLLEYLGRIDQQVKLRGYRVELGEIEGSLAALPAVAQAAVVLREDSPGDQRLVAYVVPDCEQAKGILQLLRMQREGKLTDYVKCELPNGQLVVHENRSAVELLYQEIVGNGSYLKYGIRLEPGACVFDVGANVGIFSLFVEWQAGGTRIYAFEPEPSLFEILRRNTELHGLNAELFNYGLGQRADKIERHVYKQSTVMAGGPVSGGYPLPAPFLRQEESGWRTQAEIDGTQTDPLANETAGTGVRTLSSFIREQHVESIDLLRIDSGENEWEILEGIEGIHWPRISQLVVKVGDVDGRLGLVQDLLERQGFHVTVEQGGLGGSPRRFDLFATRVPVAPQEQNGKPKSWSSPERWVAALRERLATTLPDYMIPAAFVVLQSLPLSANGKLDRRALPAPEWNNETYRPARTVNEQILCDIFAELLGAERVGVDDDFFEMGGHSFLAMRLRTIIYDRFKYDLPLSTLLRQPTVAALAKLIEEETKSTRPSSSVLVAVQPHGNRRPFFWFHPTGGQVFCYADLAREFGPDQPFYGLQSCVQASPTTFDSFEQMAALYIKEIRRVQEKGPYLLGGWSLGGVVAWEVAQQLQQQAETIGLLALIDSHPPKPAEFSGNGNAELSSLAMFALDIAHLLGKAPGNLHDSFSQLTPEEQWSVVQEALTRDGLVSSETASAEMRKLFEAFNANLLAYRGYSMRPSDQRVVLFCQSDTEHSNHLAKEWSTSARGGVDVHLVPGDHYSMIRQPQVASIVEALNLYLENLERETAR